ncbi:MAG: rRNA maturation RNase YbeY [Lachnospiraceae bacterium]|nr:rRNA maturation RNase YbeY [Lachnospiraceae bacterium]
MTEDAAPFALSEEDMMATAEAVVNKTLEIHDCDRSCQVDLYLTDDENIREINRENRDIDKVTDVLSFPNLPFSPENTADFSILDEMSEADYTDPESGNIMLGEIVICKSKVISQAEEYGHSIKREFAFLTAHSILHLLGYDHMEDDDRVVMEEKQRQILDSLGITRQD